MLRNYEFTNRSHPIPIIDIEVEGKPTSARISTSSEITCINLHDISGTKLEVSKMITTRGYDGRVAQMPSYKATISIMIDEIESIIDTEVVLVDGHSLLSLHDITSVATIEFSADNYCMVPRKSE